MVWRIQAMPCNRRSTDSVAAAGRAYAMRFRVDRDVLEVFGIQPQRGELSAPDAAGIDGVDAKAGETVQRRPVAADDARIAPTHARHFKPGIQTRLLRAGYALRIEIDAAVDVAIA